MLWTFPLAWLLLGLPFASAALILRTPPLRQLSGAHHRLMWGVGVIGLCAFVAGLVGLLAPGLAVLAVLGGGAIAGFACLWPRRPDDDGGDDWRHWSSPPDDERPPPPGLPDLPIDWDEFDYLRARWERRRRGRSASAR